MLYYGSSWIPPIISVLAMSDTVEAGSVERKLKHDGKAWLAAGESD
jgi:hypothetical protein